MTTISIIVLTRNRQKLLQKCLSSIKKANIKNCEVIVVDNGSTDRTNDVVKNFKAIRYFFNKSNMGVAKARNFGIKIAKGKIIVFLDDDAYLKGDPITPMVSLINLNRKIAVIGPKLLYPNGKLQESVRKFPTLLSILWRGTILSYYLPNLGFYKEYLMTNFDHEKTADVDWVIGACQVIKKSVFKKIGYLDENFFFGYEDIDFCKRVKKSGMRVVYFPRSEVFHYYQRSSAKKIFSRAKLEHIKSIVYYFLKNVIIAALL